MLTETEKKLVQDVYERMQQGDTLALVSALFLPEEEKGYLMYLCEKETHDEA